MQAAVAQSAAVARFPARPHDAGQTGARWPGSVSRWRYEGLAALLFLSGRNGVGGLRRRRLRRGVGCGCGAPEF
jgi:hypothetical protein